MLKKVIRVNNLVWTRQHLSEELLQNSHNYPYDSHYSKYKLSEEINEGYHLITTICCPLTLTRLD